MTPSARWSALLLFAALAGGAMAPPPAPREIRGIEGLTRAYDAILQARFDQVEAELRRACGPAPREACDVLAATALWWRILLDPQSRLLDEQFSTSVQHAIRTCEVWTETAPDSAEAWFYLGAAYAARAQWLVLRNEKLAAARDGKSIKAALEQATTLDPALHDAYFGIGMYKYYADVAPAAAKVLRFLLLLPGGDRKEGLEQMLRARSRGRLLQGEADYQLHVIYLWYERQTPRALQLLADLNAHYPGNPLFLTQIAEIQDAYQHDITASLATWHTLLAASREPRSDVSSLGEVQARIGIARQLDALSRTDEAIEALEAVVARRPLAPYSSLPLAYLRLGQAHDRLGRRAPAIEAYRAAIAATPSPDPYSIRNQANEHLRRAPDPKRSEAYRLSLEGWRHLEQNDLIEAGAALDRSIALNGADPVARYRLGRLYQARKQDAQALVEFDHAIRYARNCPPPVLAAVHLDAARIHERFARRDRAIAHYRTVSSIFGAGADSGAAAARALARLRAPQ